MKIIYQIGIIFSLCWVSQIVEALLPIDFALLVFRVLKVVHIREKSDFLLANMAFFFVPAGVSIINYFDVLKSSVVQLLLICLFTTVLTFAATAGSIRLTLKLMNRRKGGRENG